MKRMNLQLFAKWDDNSIVDYLKSTGQDSSYSARKELAESMGISNYSGSASQNTEMLNALKNGSGGSSGSSSSSNSNGPGGANNGDLLSQIEAMLSGFGGSSGRGGGGGGYSQSKASKAAQKQAQAKLQEMSSLQVEDIVSKETWDKINTPFKESTAYTDAMNYTNELLKQLSAGRTSYTDQIKDLLGQIQNRDEFSYDMSNDTLFQQSLASAMASGKTAMQDTMGQAAALTGGYGSTYATSAANQAYNGFIEDAYNNLPEYYEMALQAYQMEGNEMYNQLSALNAADASEYEKMYNSWNSNFQNAQQMYQNEYSKWQDEIGTAFNEAQLQLSEHSALFDQAYKTYQATLGLSDSMWSQEFNQWNAEEDLAYKYESLAQDKEQYESDLQYKYDSLAQNQSQFEASLAQDQAQFEANLSQKKTSGGTVSKSGSKSSTPTETQMKNGLKAFNEGGDAGLEQYLASLNKDTEADEEFLTMIIDYAHSYGEYVNPTVTYKKVKDTTNWLWGVDNNDVVVDQNGKEWKISQLPEQFREALTKLKEGETYEALWEDEEAWRKLYQN